VRAFLVWQLHDVKPDKQDMLTRLALDYLSHTSDRSRSTMLDAAVERKYSASPGETFYTGGGAQTFNNFEASDNGRILTVHRAFQHSVNLVFVRLMRDIVRYEMVQTAGPTSQWLDDPATRHAYLTRFADQESRVYMHRFDTKYRGKTPDDALAALLHDVRKSPPKVATVLRSVAPDAPQPWFDAQMRAALKRTPAASLSSDDLAKLYAKYGIDKFNLNDRGYIASVHPLELWTVNYLRDHPLATESQLQEASRAVRFTAYSWLFKTRYHGTQDRRIKRMVELQAFAEIGKSWRALGYPFATLTPSSRDLRYANASTKSNRAAFCSPWSSIVISSRRSNRKSRALRRSPGKYSWVVRIGPFGACTATWKCRVRPGYRPGTMVSRR
jgi:membrane peptidoglycan carboxypeptidase